MATLATLLVKVDSDTRGLQGGLDKASRSAGGFASRVSGAGKRLQGFGKSATVFATLPLVGLGNAAVNAASDLNESINAIRVVFGPASRKIEQFGKTSAQTVGLSTRAFNELVTPVGAALQNVGFSQDEAASASINLAKRASDMASVFNVDVEDALAAIQAGLRGEMDPLERFGVGLSAAAVRSHALETGLIDTDRELTANEKAQARLSLIMAQTDKIAGDFARTSGEVANQERIAKAEAENMAASFGQKLIPIKAKVIEVAGSLIDRFMNLSPGMQDIILKILTLAAVAGPFVFVLGSMVRTVGSLIKVGGSLIKVFGFVGKAFLALSKILLANPWALVALAIIALVIVVVKNWDTIKNAILTAWNAVVGFLKRTTNAIVGFFKRNWPIILGILTGPIGAAVIFIIRNWDKIRSAAGNLVGAIARFFTSLPGRIRNGLQWMVRGIGNMLRSAGRFAIDIAKWLVDNVIFQIAKIPHRIHKAISGVWRTFFNWGKGLVRNFIAGFKSVWNSSIGGLGFSLPSWIPGIGGKEFRIPRLHQGGIVPGTGEKLILALGGEVVLSREQVRALGGRGVAVPPPAQAMVTFDFRGADSELGRALRKMVRVEGQGNAQVAFGG